MELTAADGHVGVNCTLPVIGKLSHCLLGILKPAVPAEDLLVGEYNVASPSCYVLYICRCFLSKYYVFGKAGWISPVFRTSCGDTPTACHPAPLFAQFYHSLPTQLL